MVRVDVQPGQIYWVEVNNTRHRVRAEEKSRTIPQWWRCTLPLGTEIMVPESAFLQECNDTSGFNP